jgi:hypothetical protein
MHAELMVSWWPFQPRKSRHESRGLRRGRCQAIYGEPDIEIWRSFGSYNFSPSSCNCGLVRRYASFLRLLVPTCSTALCLANCAVLSLELDNRGDNDSDWPHLPPKTRDGVWQLYDVFQPGTRGRVLKGKPHEGTTTTSIHADWPGADTRSRKALVLP